MTEGAKDQGRGVIRHPPISHNLVWVVDTRDCLKKHLPFWIVFPYLLKVTLYEALNIRKT